MSIVAPVDGFRKLDNENIAFYDDLYVVDNAKNTVTFTTLGAAYYGSWFRRYGFRFDGIDADTFISTVRDINRLLWDRDVEAEQAAHASMTAEEKAVWTLWDEGRFEEFNEAIVALAEKRKAEGSSRVIPLFGRKPSDN